MFKKEAFTFLFVLLFAIASLGFVFYSETSITGAITGFAAKSFLDSANEAVQGLVKTSPDVLIENPLRVSKAIESIFEIQVSEGVDLPRTDSVPIVVAPAEWCSKNWREREDCTRTGGNITGTIKSLSKGKPDYLCACDCVTLLGGRNESVINNRKCACKSPNLEILGTPPRCQTKCSNTGGRHENNDPAKPCICTQGTVYIQNAGCTKVIFQNQTTQKPPTQNISTTQQISPTPITSSTIQPAISPTQSPTPTIAQTKTPSPNPTNTQISPQTYLPVTIQTQKHETTDYQPQTTRYQPPSTDYKPPTYTPTITPYSKPVEYYQPIPPVQTPQPQINRQTPTPTPKPAVVEYKPPTSIYSQPQTTRYQPPSTDYKPPATIYQPQVVPVPPVQTPVRAIPQKLSEEQCKSLLNNFAKQQYES
ncbi:MAG: hypothetical protein AABX39_02875, partial [Nanoarchaeota archaeon]